MKLAPRNPIGKVMVSILAFEAVVFGLAIAGMIQVDNVPVPIAVTAATLGVVLAVVAIALLRFPVGYLLGWITQRRGVGHALLGQVCRDLMIAEFPAAEVHGVDDPAAEAFLVAAGAQPGPGYDVLVKPLGS